METLTTFLNSLLQKGIHTTTLSSDSKIGPNLMSGPSLYYLMILNSGKRVSSGRSSTSYAIKSVFEKLIK
jgi:hypothetical protein